MTRTETLQILAVLQASYPAFYSRLSKPDLERVVALWTEMFSAEDYNLTKYAVKELIATHTGYPPDIAALKNKIDEIKSAALDKPTHEELWIILKAAVSNGYYGSSEEFEKLPPVLKRYCGSPATLREYALIDSDTFNTVVHGQFLKQIKIIENREEYAQRLPAEVRELIGSLAKPLELAATPSEAEHNRLVNETIRRIENA